MSIIHCHQCPHASPPPYNGACYCLFDKQHPVNILDRAAFGVCPDGRFKNPPQQKSIGPGDVVKLVLHALGYTAVTNCGCEVKRQEMNKLGWWGCWKQRKQLVKWFIDKAREAGIEVKEDRVLQLLILGWRDQREKLRKTK